MQLKGKIDNFLNFMSISFMIADIFNITLTAQMTKKAESYFTKRLGMQTEKLTHEKNVCTFKIEDGRLKTL